MEAHHAVLRPAVHRRPVVDLFPKRAIHAHGSTRPFTRLFRRASLVRCDHRRLVLVDGYVARHHLVVLDAGYRTADLWEGNGMVIRLRDHPTEQFWHVHRPLRTVELVGYSPRPGRDSHGHPRIGH